MSWLGFFPAHSGPLVFPPLVTEWADSPPILGVSLSLLPAGIIMFEATKVGRSLSKEEFIAQEEALRAELLQIQQELKASSIPVMIIVAGVEGAGVERGVERL